MVIVRDSFHVEFEMEQKMSSESKKMFETYYECRVQFRFHMYSKEEREREITKSQQEIIHSQFIGVYHTYTKKQIQSGVITISDYDLVYYTVKDKMERLKLLINKCDEVDGGFDIYLGNLNDIHKIKRYLSRGYFALYTHSKKIMGHNFLKSKDLYRHSMLIAIYNLKAGDSVLVKGEEYSIKSIDKQNLNVVHKTNFDKTRFHFNTIKDYLSKIDDVPENISNKNSEDFNSSSDNDLADKQ